MLLDTYNAQKNASIIYLGLVKSHYEREQLVKGGGGQIYNSEIFFVLYPFLSCLVYQVSLFNLVPRLPLGK